MNYLKLINKHGISGINHQYLDKFKNNKELNNAIFTALPKLYNKNEIDYQKNTLNFYHKDLIVPYNSVTAQGPWIIGDNGSILYDVGGYGMLGFGHNPEWANKILAKPQVMANVMTPNKNQLKFTNVLKKNIGINRKRNICPYEKFGFLNSGSEAIELATKICDSIYKDSKKESIYIVLEGSFHGRTGNASKLSDSCKNNYQSNLKSFQHKIPVYTVPINNIQQFITTFNLLKTKYTIEAVFFEPVMGEGNPGIELNKEFYHIARKMTKENKSLLIIDSIQAGIRTNGYLSIVDYPKIKNEDPPDMEIFSKAVNSGQYPLSVLAVSKEISDQFKTGIYGNTMTGNPKAMDIGIETLSRLNDDVRKNIILKGYSFFYMLQKMKNNYPYMVEKITGQGLLLAMHIKKEYKVIDSNKGLEYICRKNGLNVIHGGDNALRFTPYFLINDDEIDLVHKILETSFDEYTNRFIRKIT